MSARRAALNTLALPLLSVLALSGCGPAAEADRALDAPPPAAPGPVDAVDAVDAALAAGGRVEVIVELVPPRVAALADLDEIGLLEARESGIAAAGSAVTEALAAEDLDVVEAYRYVPSLHVEVRSPAALAALRARPEVAAVHLNEVLVPFLAESLPLIEQPQVLGDGRDGSGTAVAVLDTGLDYTRAAFGSCPAPGAPGCRVAYVQDFAPADGILDDPGTGRHGTNVAGIVAGVAPGASLLGLDVFHGGGASSSTVVSAINWCIANRGTYNIVAVNMSLGVRYSKYQTPCSADPHAAAVQAARSAGIVVAIAAGNDGQADGISSPACVAGATAVGAVNDGGHAAADTVAGFSNSGNLLALLAPGAVIHAAELSMSGTSQATPHVAGAVAVVRGAFPGETAEDALERLTSTGVPVTDPRNALVRPRIDLAAATAGSCIARLDRYALSLPAGGGSATVAITTAAGCAWTATSPAGWLSLSPASGTGPGSVTVTAASNGGGPRSATLAVAGRDVAASQGDATGPVGAVTISGGEVTRATAVSLALSATDGSGVAAMCVSNTATCTAWTPYATWKSWTLSSGGAGTRTVSVWFKDGLGNVSAAAATDTVVYDASAPSGGAVQASGADAQAALSWWGFTDAGSGVAAYRVVMAAAAPPASCAAGALVYEGAATSHTQAGLSNGATYGFRVCAVDAAGNVSAGATTTARPAPEYGAPSGSVAIAGGELTGTLSVTLQLAASDPSGVSAMCISNTTACSTWEAFATSRAWTLAGGGSGVRTVRVWFRDVHGNASPGAISDTITYDGAPPSGGSISGAPSNGQVALSWKGFTDAPAGVASYALVFAPDAPPASCAAGTELYAGAATSFTHAGLVNGQRYGYRVCAIDRAGNVSAGATTTAQPPSEYDAPAGAVTIQAGAAVTRATAVTLSISATDATGVAAMCVSNAATCTAWKPFATSLPWTLAAGAAGTRTVSVWFRDAWGNASAAPATDTILLDATAPTSGAVSAAGGDGQVALSWSGFGDGHSGVAGYRVAYQAGAAPATCAAGTLAWQGLGGSFTVTGLSNGTTYGFRVCAVDGAGNVSTGGAATARPAPEYAPPAGTVTITGGEVRATLAVTLAISATDASGVPAMCVSNATTCTAWEAYATSKAWTLQGGGSGVRTVRVWFRDAHGNATPAGAPASDTVTYDVSGPTGGSLSASPGAGQVALSWSGFTDAASGVASYRLVAQQGTVAPPARCEGGTLLATGAGTSFVHSGLAAGASWSYRVCPVDVLENVGAGVTRTARAP
jgi:subtilisin family serine protease